MFFATFRTYFLIICSILSLSPIMANRPTSHFLLPFHCFYHIVAISFHMKFSSFPLTFSSLHPFTLLPFFHLFFFYFFRALWAFGHVVMNFLHVLHVRSRNILSFPFSLFKGGSDRGSSSKSNQYTTLTPKFQ